jgi:hypothetical protein
VLLVVAHYTHKFVSYTYYTTTALLVLLGGQNTYPEFGQHPVPSAVEPEHKTGASDLTANPPFRWEGGNRESKLFPKLTYTIELLGLTTSRCLLPVDLSRVKAFQN